MDDTVELTLSDDDHGCARCGLVEIDQQPVTLVRMDDGHYRGFFLCPDCAR